MIPAAPERPSLELDVLALSASRATWNGSTAALVDDRERERELDRAYWAPLRQELESLRRKS
jgi:hypothetical protein